MSPQKSTSVLDYKKHLNSLRSLYQKPVVRSYTNLVLTLLTLAFLAITAIRPTLKTVGGLYKEIKDKREVSAKMTKKISSLSQAQINYERIKPQLQNLEKTIPQQPQFAQLVWQIEYLAVENQVKLDTFQVGKAVLMSQQSKNKTKDKVDSISIDLSAIGKYPDLKNFSKDLEQLKRIVNVKQIDLTEPKKTKSNDTQQTTNSLKNLQISLQAQVFYFQKDQK